MLKLKLWDPDNLIIEHATTERDCAGLSRVGSGWSDARGLRLSKKTKKTTYSHNLAIGIIIWLYDA